MNKIKCYNCGGDVLFNGDARIGYCSSCMAEIPIPKEENEDIVELYSKANSLLSEKQFDKANALFLKILEANPLDSAACWGMAVSEYGIELVTDPATFEQKPTLHRLSTQYFTEYLYYKKAVEYAVTTEEKQFYASQGEIIDGIQRKSLQICKDEEPYDIFICYKKTAEGENRTADSRIAGDLYKDLTRRGYKVFFAEKTLTVGTEYEPRIFAALNSARILIAIASKPEYYEAPWVKNEWSRYANIIFKDKTDKAERLLIPMYQNQSHDELPEELRHMPKYVEMDSLENPKQVLFGYIAEHFGTGQTENTEDVTSIRRQANASRYSSEQTSGGAAENMLARGMIALVNGDYESARAMFEQSFKTEKLSDAYLGLMMCELFIPGMEALNSYDADITKNKYFQSAMETATEEKKKQYADIANACIENEKWTAACRKKQNELGNSANSLYMEIDRAVLDEKPYKEYKRIDGWIDGFFEAYDDKSIYSVNASVFWKFGILIPALLLLVCNLLDMLPYETFGSLAMTVTGVLGGCISICMLLGAVMLFRLLSETGFFEDHFILRIIVTVAEYMFLNVAVIEKDYNVLFIAGGIIAYMIYFLISGRKRDAAVRKINKCKREYSHEKECSKALKEEMNAVALSKFTKLFEPYKQYFKSEAEYKEVLDGYIKRAAESNRKKCAELDELFETVKKK